MAGEYSSSEVEAITNHLNKLAASPMFAQAERLVSFLRYVVGEELGNGGKQVNQYALAMELYSRDESFDPATDSVVRVDAGRLRTKLREYYDTDGQEDQVRFELPKGKYVVKIHFDSTVNSNTPPAINTGAKNTENSSINSKQSLPGKYSIVVLPIEALSRDIQDQELADGITTEVINDLGRSDAFDVASRYSAFAYKGQNKDAREVGEDLNVNYVLEGSLRRAGNRVRIAVALIDAHSNHQIWTDSYDHELGDMLELQDHIGKTVAAALGGVQWRATIEATKHIDSDNLNPDVFIDRANEMFLNYSPHSFETGIQIAKRMMEIDPNVGHPHALIGFIRSHEFLNLWTDQIDEARTEALVAADRAIELSPRNTWVLGITSETLMWLGGAHRSVSLSERALALAPDTLLNQARAWLGDALIHINRGEEGLALIERAIEGSPGEHFTPPWYFIFRAWAFTQLAKYKEAAESARTAIRVHIGNTPFLVVYANALAEIGQIEEASITLAELRRQSPILTLEHLESVYRAAFEPQEIAERYTSGLRKLNWE